MALSKRIERLLMTSGAVLLAWFFMLRLYGSAGALLGGMAFEAAHPKTIGQEEPTKRAASSGISGSIDFSLWSEKRIKAFEASLARNFAPPLALLNIPRIHLEVPVFNGTDEDILNRGVGRIAGTAHVGRNGNLAIAGHRDGFFRALKDVRKGDVVELIGPNRKFLYQVETITIVTPDDVHVLEDRIVPTITLITCYPFYFFGDAPQRYVLQCALKESDPLTGRGQSGNGNRTHTTQERQGSR
jgi:sortase A